MEQYPYQNITEKIIRCCFNVYDELGSGFLESVYEKSLQKELQECGLKCESQKSIHVYFKNTLVGEFRADLIVAGKVLVEIKSISTLQKIHEA
jgi:GxxExxY protein